MTTDHGPNALLVTLNKTLSGDWEADKEIIREAAMQPTPAENFYEHAAAIQGLFNILTYGTKFAPNHPQRSGLLRKVYDELFPIAHFAKLYFSKSNTVLIEWIDGNQNFDATVKYKSIEPRWPDIRYLEVTTLQDRDDARQLEELSKENTIQPVVESEYETHRRKVDLFKMALKKKGGKDYPPNTALLVYTDEARFRQFYFGMPKPEINKKRDYEAALRESSHLLDNFSHVFVYSMDEIYCAWPPHLNQNE